MAKNSNSTLNFSIENDEAKLEVWTDRNAPLNGLVTVMDTEWEKLGAAPESFVSIRWRIYQQGYAHVDLLAFRDRNPQTPHRATVRIITKDGISYLSLEPTPS